MELRQLDEMRKFVCDDVYLIDPTGVATVTNDGLEVFAVRLDGMR